MLVGDCQKHYKPLLECKLQKASFQNPESEVEKHNITGSEVQTKQHHKSTFYNYCFLTEEKGNQKIKMSNV